MGINETLRDTATATMMGATTSSKPSKWLTICSIGYISDSIMSYMQTKDIINLMRTSSSNLEVFSKKLYKELSYDGYEELKEICESQARLEMYCRCVKTIECTIFEPSDPIARLRYFDPFPNATYLYCSNHQYSSWAAPYTLSRHFTLDGSECQMLCQYFTDHRITLGIKDTITISPPEKIPPHWQHRAIITLFIQSADKQWILPEDLNMEDVHNQIKGTVRSLKKIGDITSFNFISILPNTWLAHTFKNLSTDEQYSLKHVQIRYIDKGVFNVLSALPNQLEILHCGDSAYMRSINITLYDFIQNIKTVQSLTHLKEFSITCVRKSTDDQNDLVTFPTIGTPKFRHHSVRVRVHVVYWNTDIPTAKELDAEKVIIRSLARYLFHALETQDMIFTAENHAELLLSSEIRGLHHVFANEIKKLSHQRRGNVVRDDDDDRMQYLCERD